MKEHSMNRKHKWTRHPSIPQMLKVTSKHNRKNKKFILKELLQITSSRYLTENRFQHLKINFADGIFEFLPKYIKDLNLDVLENKMNEKEHLRNVETWYEFFSPGNDFSRLLQKQ